MPWAKVAIAIHPQLKGKDAILKQQIAQEVTRTHHPQQTMSLKELVLRMRKRRMKKQTKQVKGVESEAAHEGGMTKRKKNDVIHPKLRFSLFRNIMDED